MPRHRLARRHLTVAAGWLAVGLGAAHTVVASLDDRRTLTGAWADGWWDTVRLAEPTTPSEAERTTVLWRTLGSFGAPMLALGSLVLWSERRNGRVPAGIGWVLLAWGVPFTAMMPRSPSWTVPVIGALLVAGDREPRS
ncbi:DUF6463 family protein [Pseudonocardia sp. NPDC049635]|uniref:DUF6463 family protein n=1 Tax=Pseudonocardia sp. NPDC049635 TaxID=3155506 RepID=UPI0033C54D01